MKELIASVRALDGFALALGSLLVSQYSFKRRMDLHLCLRLA